MHVHYKFRFFGLSEVGLDPTSILTPTIIRHAPPPRDEAEAEVEPQLVGQVVGGADGLHVVVKGPRRGQTHQGHVVVERRHAETLVHSQSVHGPALRVFSRRGEHV